MEGLRVRPITYNLDGDRELMNPSFKVSSGSTSSIMSTQMNQDVNMQRKEKGNICIEVMDGDEMIGKGHVSFNTLKDREGMFNEWIPLMDEMGNQTGQALVEIEISPDAGKLEGGMMKGMIKDMKEAFGNFSDSMLPSQNFPSLKGMGMDKNTLPVMPNERNEGQMGVDRPNIEDEL